MGNLHGPVVNGVVQVEQRVKFMREVQSGLFYPWSNVWYVDGVNGDDDYDGRGPSSAKETIQAAVTAASRGDVIYVRPKAASVSTGFNRYVEAVTVPLATSDLSIVGVTRSLNPDFGPKMRFATTGYCITNRAHALHVENMGFLRGGTSTGCISLENDGATNLKRGTDGTTLYNCTFKYGYGVYAASGGDGLVISRCRFSDCSDSFYYTNSANPGRRMRIEYCDFVANNGSAVARAYIRILPPLTDAVIKHCTFDLEPTAGKFIHINGTSCTGIIADCYFAQADVTQDTEVDGGGLQIVACYDETGILA